MDMSLLERLPSRVLASDALNANLSRESREALADAGATAAQKSDAGEESANQPVASRLCDQIFSIGMSLLLSGSSYVAAMALMNVVMDEIGPAKGYNLISYVLWTAVVLYYGSYRAHKWRDRLIAEEFDADTKRIERKRAAREDAEASALTRQKSVAVAELLDSTMSERNTLLWDEIDRQASRRSTCEDEETVAEGDVDQALAVAEEEEALQLRAMHQLRAEVLTRVVDQIVDACAHAHMPPRRAAAP